MNHTLISRLLTCAAAYAGTAPAFAHGGHGLAGSHWHATDTAGLVFVAVLAGLAVWLSRDR